MTTTTRADGTVFLVDDDPAVRDSLGQLLESVGLPCRTFGTAGEFLTVYDATMPGCLVLDIRLPGMSGIELHRQLAADGITIPVIMMTGYGDVALAVEAMQRGVLDFLEKPIRAQHLLDRVQQALTQDAEHRQAKDKHDAAAARLALLTARERQVVELAVTGLTNKEIAYECGVSSQAIDAHRAKAMTKLRVNNVPQLVRFIVEAGQARQSANEPWLVQPVH